MHNQGMSSSTGIAPDGGWGWMVVLGVAMTNMFNQSLVSLFGLLFGEHLRDLGQGTVGAALIMNINSVVLNFSGLITGPALKTFSARQVAIAGSLLTGLGLVLSSMSTQLWHIIIAYGVFVGLGLGFINPSSFLAVNSYFSTKRGRAVGLALAGTGVGQMIMPYVVRILLDEYGFKGTTLVMGALALNGVVGASLFQPVEWHMKHFNENQFNEKKMLLQPCRHKNLDSNKNNLSDLEANDFIDEDGDDDDDDDLASLNSEVYLINEPSWRQRIFKAMDLQLLRDPIFISISVGLALAYTASTNFSMLFPYFLQETAGLSRSDTAMCMSILAAADLASRLSLPTITDKLQISCRMVFLIGAILLTITRTVLAETLKRNELLIMSAIYGYVRAATVVNQNLTISEYASEDKLAGALGLNMIAKGIFVMTIGQLLGWIRDYSGSYPVCLYAQNVLLIIVIVIWTPEMLYRRYRSYRTRTHPVAI